LWTDVKYTANVHNVCIHLYCNWYSLMVVQFQCVYMPANQTISDSMAIERTCCTFEQGLFNFTDSEIVKNKLVGSAARFVLFIHSLKCKQHSFNFDWKCTVTVIYLYCDSTCARVIYTRMLLETSPSFLSSWSEMTASISSTGRWLINRVRCLIVYYEFITSLLQYYLLRKMHYISNLVGL